MSHVTHIAHRESIHARITWQIPISHIREVMRPMLGVTPPLLSSFSQLHRQLQSINCRFFSRINIDYILAPDGNISVRTSAFGLGSNLGLATRLRLDR